ncbi:protein of unknown function [Agreia sp. COWG]|nr:protein of unknown function [Agreia sp. COWG]
MTYWTRPGDGRRVGRGLAGVLSLKYTRHLLDNCKLQSFDS